MKAAEERKFRRILRNSGYEMVLMQQKLHDIGLHETARAVNAASQKLGWEAARILEQHK